MGGCHGIAQALENTIIPKKYRNSTGIFWFIRVIFVFAFCSFAWIFFVSNSIGDAIYVINHLFDNISSPIAYLYDGFVDIGMDKERLAIVASMILLMAIYDFFALKIDVISEIGKKNKVIRWIIYVCLGVIIIFFSQKGVAAEFVYFQF